MQQLFRVVKSFVVVRDNKDFKTAITWNPGDLFSLREEEPTAEVVHVAANKSRFLISRKDLIENSVATPPQNLIRTARSRYND
jgi:hypothetical protein